MTFPSDTPAMEERRAKLARLGGYLGEAFRAVRVFDPDWQRNEHESLRALHEAQEKKKEK